MTANRHQQLLRITVAVITMAVSGCFWIGEKIDPAALPPPALKHYDADVLVRVDSLQPLKRDDVIRAYSAGVDIVKVIQGRNYLAKGQTLELDVEVSCVKYGKLTAGETVRLRLLRVPGKTPRFRLTPGGILRESR